MFPANAYVIRLAGEDDRATLQRLADLDAARPLAEPALIGEIGGRPAAAVSLADGGAVADPFQPTSTCMPIMRLRADAVNAFARSRRCACACSPACGSAAWRPRPPRRCSRRCRRRPTTPRR